MNIYILLNYIKNIYKDFYIYDCHVIRFTKNIVWIVFNGGVDKWLK